MLDPTINLTSLGDAIRLALTPVFLLTATANTLNVMTGRLSRIIDRGRLLTEDLPPGLSRTDTRIEKELANLERRRYLASIAISACTLAALLVCAVIASLFLEVLLNLKLPWLVGLLFTGSTLALVVGLAYFLREVNLATQTVRIRLK